MTFEANPPPPDHPRYPANGSPRSPWWRRREVLLTGAWIALALIALYGKALVVGGAGAWEGVLWVAALVTVVAVLLWAWVYGGKLRERDERDQRGDGSA